MNLISRTLAYDLAGFSLWLLALLAWSPADPLAASYVYAYLWAGPLWLVPLAYGEEWPRAYGLAAALGWVGAFGLHPGPAAAACLLPWAVLLAWWTMREWRQPDLPLFRRLAPVWLLIGLAWAAADRLGLRPLGFPPIIVLLTAIHFHYAGFALTWLAGRAGLPRAWWWLLVAGIGGVALGITAVQLGGSGWWEAVPVSLLVVAAGRAAWWQWQFSGGQAGWLSRWSWRISSLALAAGMVLAAGYGWRDFWSPDWMSIPWMYAVHGSLNALGFAWPGLLGWRLAQHRQRFWDQ
jgi:hypothetical protein